MIDGETVYRDKTDTFKIIFEDERQGFITYVNFSGRLWYQVARSRSYQKAIDGIANFKKKLNEEV